MQQRGADAGVLEDAGLAAQQLNIATKSSAHAVVLVETVNGRRLLLDPNKGVVPKAGDRVLSPDEARAMMRAGTPGGEIWRRLSPLADTDFYAGFGDAVFAVQGERLAIQADVRLTPGTVLEIGRADGSIEDTIHEAGMAGMMPHWVLYGQPLRSSMGPQPRLLSGYEGCLRAHRKTDGTIHYQFARAGDRG